MATFSSGYLMQQRDFIMRMIEQLGVALARLRQMITGQASKEEIRAEMHAAARQGGIDLEMAKLASLDTLLSLISVGGEINPSRCWLTAELLLLDGMDAEADGRCEAAAVSYEKAIRLFALLEPAGALLVGWPEARERVLEVRERLSHLEAPEAPGV
ncbi:MAG: hypothetical protein ACSLEZ_01585 [Thiobacillus sp.]